ncbi:MAG: hypothetical protein P1V51_19905 [Deltaproteobacteria bacterium]|nr:hypothetical protein [Deltaproteobacteria bacterium]
MPAKHHGKPASRPAKRLERLEAPPAERAAVAQTFFLDGPCPGENELLAAARKAGWRRRGGERIFVDPYNEMKKHWSEAVAVALWTAGTRAVDYPVHVHFRWIERNRRRDKDNVAGAKKLIIDGLRYAGILANDGWEHVVGFSDDFAVDKERPGVEITLHPRRF